MTRCCVCLAAGMVFGVVLAATLAAAAVQYVDCSRFEGF